MFLASWGPVFPRKLPLLLSFLPLCCFFGVKTCRTKPWLGILALMAGALEVLFDTRGRMLVFGLGLGAFFVFWPDLWHRQSRQQVDETTSLGAGLTLGLALSVLFRVWNFGVDPGGQGGTRLSVGCWLSLPPDCCWLNSTGRATRPVCWNLLLPRVSSKLPAYIWA